MESIKLNVDKIKVSGPKVDGSFTISLDVGEYEQDRVAKVLTIPQNTIVRVTMEQTNGSD